MIALLLAPRWVCRKSDQLVCHSSWVRTQTCSVVNKLHKILNGCYALSANGITISKRK